MHLFDKRALRAPATASFSQSRSVRFQDIDAAGIVFFSKVLDYLHDCYVSFLEGSGSKLSTVLRERRWAAPIRHAEADYFSPLRFGDDIEVRLVAAHVAESEVTLGYQVAVLDSDNPGNPRIAAVGQTVHTFVDPKSFERSEVPVELRRAFKGIGASEASGPE